MHARLLVLSKILKDDNPYVVFQRVENKLAEYGMPRDIDEKPGDENSLFPNLPIDWFIIGGRWSGILTLLYLDQNLLDYFEQRRKEVEDRYYKGLISYNTYNKTIKKLFKRLFPEYRGIPPYSRDPLSGKVFKDDAQILDKTIYDFLKKSKCYPVEASTEELLDGKCYVNIDEPYKIITEDDIGKKWIVVINFHW